MEEIFNKTILIIGIIVNIFGFYFVVQQIRQQALATRGETYSSLCGLSYEILKLLSDRPYLYPYFYEKKPLSENSDKRVEILCCCEMIANYCDNTVLQRENIPEHVWKRWRYFVCEQIANSIVLQNFLLEYREWYSLEIQIILNELQIKNHQAHF
jgi:hypothetical protein